MQDKRDKLREYLSCKKKPELDLRNSQSTKIAKGAKIKRIIVKKAFSRDKIKSLAG